MPHIKTWSCNKLVSFNIHYTIKAQSHFGTISPFIFRKNKNNRFCLFRNHMKLSITITSIATCFVAYWEKLQANATLCCFSYANNNYHTHIYINCTWSTIVPGGIGGIAANGEGTLLWLSRGGSPVWAARELMAIILCKLCATVNIEWQEISATVSSTSTKQNYYPKVPRFIDPINILQCIFK